MRAKSPGSRIKPDPVLSAVTDELIANLAGLSFSSPVHTVYNPLVYARRPYDRYLARYGKGKKDVLLVGMNPGPWGMAQTGVPFGQVEIVRDWLKIEEPVDRPAVLHPKRPIEGFTCRRKEVSGTRLWGWARERFRKPERFFKRFFVLNYCPLVFFERDGRNRTPDKLRAAERKALYTACNVTLRKTVEYFSPRFVIGIGRFAEQRAREALGEATLGIGRITHPSPANPRANRGWAGLVDEELKAILRTDF